MARIVIDPVSRIEGHLKIDATVENGFVREAHCSGMMFRGLEIILRGRDPRDAQRIMQRACGVCPTAHAMAATLALDDAFGVAGRIPDNGRVLRNLMFGANYLQSHVLQFYHLTALDYVDVASAAEYRGSDPRLRMVADFIARGNLAPFLPRYEGDYRLPAEINRSAVSHYVEALDIRRDAHELAAIFGGKMPHNMGIFPGGALDTVTVDKVARFRWRLERIREFVDNVYIPDVLAVAAHYPDYFSIGAGCKRYLSYGNWDLDTEPDLTVRRRLLPRGVLDAGSMALEEFEPANITEQVRHSWYSSRSDLHPSVGDTHADPRKPGAYSFIKAPRYAGGVCEVGPLARFVVAYASGHERVRTMVDDALSTLDADITALFSVLGRHAARALEAKLVGDMMAQWLLEIEPGGEVCADFDMPEESTGMGITEAPRGALGHWIDVKDGVIANYQAVVPTTWNCSPRDDGDVPGAIEQALEGSEVRDEENPFELVRIVRSFDPCLACSIHTVTPAGRDLALMRVG